MYYGGEGGGDCVVLPLKFCGTVSGGPEAWGWINLATGGDAALWWERAPLCQPPPPHPTHPTSLVPRSSAMLSYPWTAVAFLWSWGPDKSKKMCRFSIAHSIRFVNNGNYAVDNCICISLEGVRVKYTEMLVQRQKVCSWCGCTWCNMILLSSPSWMNLKHRISLLAGLYHRLRPSVTVFFLKLRKWGGDVRSPIGHVCCKADSCLANKQPNKCTASSSWCYSYYPNFFLTWVLDIMVMPIQLALCEIIS